MSHWTSLYVNTGSTEIEVWSRNHTSNTAGMWRKALGIPLYELDGRNAGECVTLLEKAVIDMRDHAEEYTTMNPANGWGSYESALWYLSDILEQCKAYPATTVYVSH